MPEDIPSGLAEAGRPPSPPPDINTKKEGGTLQDQRYSWDTYLRIGLAFWSAGVVTWWLCSVLGIIKENNSIYCLSDAVLIALIGTTTLNVIGLVIIVLNGLFPKTDKSS